MKSNVMNQALTQKFNVHIGSVNFKTIEHQTVVIEGDDFYVVCKKDGWTEVYDRDFKIIGKEVFLNVLEIEAGQHIKVTLKNGWTELYDKWLNMKSIKYMGDKES